MNNSEKVFFDELMTQVSSIEKLRKRAEAIKDDPMPSWKEEGCHRPGPGGDCENYLGSLPENEPNTEYGKPPGWCWSCWQGLRYQIKITEVSKMREALQWCSGSSDFGSGGVAESGWKKSVQPLLDEHFDVDPVGRVAPHNCSQISSSEALFGFMGWLTTRDEAVTFSGHHEAGKAADLVALFCKVNDLPEPREGWDKNLISPKGQEPVSPKGQEPLPSEPTRDTLVGVGVGDQTESLEELSSRIQSAMSGAVTLLSGDLNYDRVAEAKDLLKRALEVSQGDQYA